MAFWGAPSPNPDHAADACRAALACQQAIRAADLQDDAGRPLRVRIGINSGNVLVGNIGSELRLNYTVIGDAVNVASRLEGANKAYGSQIIIGEETRRLAGDAIQVRELDQPDGLRPAGRVEDFRIDRNGARWAATALGRAIRNGTGSLPGAQLFGRGGLLPAGAGAAGRRTGAADARALP